jgi:hypothetical protein
VQRQTQRLPVSAGPPLVKKLTTCGTTIKTEPHPQVRGSVVQWWRPEPAVRVSVCTSPVTCHGHQPLQQPCTCQAVTPCVKLQSCAQPSTSTLTHAHSHQVQAGIQHCQDQAITVLFCLLERLPSPTLPHADHTLVLACRSYADPAPAAQAASCSVICHCTAQYHATSHPATPGC